MWGHLAPIYLFPWQEVPLVKLFPEINKEDAEKTLQSGPLAILVSDLAVSLGVICQCCSKGECCKPLGECYDVEQGDECLPGESFRLRSADPSDLINVPCQVSFALGVPVEVPVEVCTSHDECSNSDYCDDDGKCHDCSVCDSFEDSIDGSCPECSAAQSAPSAAQSACDAQCKGKFRLGGDFEPVPLSLSLFLENIIKNECVEALESAYPDLKNQLALWVDGEISMADLKDRFPDAFKLCQEMVDQLFGIIEEMANFCTETCDFNPLKGPTPSPTPSPTPAKEKNSWIMWVLLGGAVLLVGIIAYYYFKSASR